MKNVIFIASIAVIVIGFIVVFNNSADNEQALLSETLKDGNSIQTPAPIPNEGDLKVEILVKAKNAKAATVECGDAVTAHYTGWLLNGTKFDSSLDRGKPFTFTACAGQVIKGWDQGFLDLPEGSKAKLVIPSLLAYGAEGAGAQIPPYSTLIFEVEIVDIVKGLKTQQ